MKFGDFLCLSDTKWCWGRICSFQLSLHILLCQAEEDQQLTYDIHLDMKDAAKGQTYFEEIRQLYYRVNCQLGDSVDLLKILLSFIPWSYAYSVLPFHFCYLQDEFSHVVQEWNAQRSQALERALSMILYPQMVKEIKGKLIEEAKECILRVCWNSYTACYFLKLMSGICKYWIFEISEVGNDVVCVCFAELLSKALHLAEGGSIPR